MIIIGKAMRALRVNLGLTQKQMVKGTKISITHYSKMEKGQNRIFVDDLIEILKARHISLSDFFSRYVDKSNVLNKSESLNMAFYSNDLDKAKKIKKDILSSKESSIELKDRAILIVDALSQNNKNLEKVMKDFFLYENWTEYDSAIIILSNSIRTTNLENIKPLIFKLIKKYNDLGTQNIERQRRLGTVGINFLFNFRKNSKGFDNTVVAVLKWLETLSCVPELGIIKEIYRYFLFLYTDRGEQARNIKETLKLSGYESISSNLPS